MLESLGATSCAKCFLNLFAMSKSFASLESISLRGCSADLLTKLHLVQIIILQCRKITNLDLSWVEAVDDEVLQVLGEKHKLETLQLRACENITDAGVIGFFERQSGFSQLRTSLGLESQQVTMERFILLN